LMACLYPKKKENSQFIITCKALPSNFGFSFPKIRIAVPNGWLGHIMRTCKGPWIDLILPLNESNSSCASATVGRN
jgi:hypothetical protein